MNRDRQTYMKQVYAQMMNDLHYPVARDGSIMDASAIKHWVAWHLTRAGWRKPNNRDHLPLDEDYDEPLIKPRKVIAPGVVEDAVAWVPFDTDDDPLANLPNMTMTQIDALPADLRRQAKQRLGLPVDQPEPRPGWTAAPVVNVTDEYND